VFEIYGSGSMTGVQHRENNWTFVLFTPDALIQQPLTGLIGRLHNYGLVPRVGRLLRIDAATMVRAYYASGLNPGTLPPLHIFKRWYDLGPGCLLLLHREGGGACVAMLRAKGATDPDRAHPDSFRFAGENALMNLVHCPDDERIAARELVDLLGEAGASQMKSAAEMPDSQMRELTVDTLGEALPAYTGPEALSVPLIINRLRLRIVQRLAPSSHQSADTLVTLTQVRQELKRERDELIRVGTSAARMSVAASYNSQIHRRLREVATRCGEPAWLKAVVGLSHAIVGPKEERSAALVAIRSCDIYVSQFEDAALDIDAYG
jgi:hypothetical protein